LDFSRQFFFALQKLQIQFCFRKRLSPWISLLKIIFTGSTNYERILIYISLNDLSVFGLFPPIFFFCPPKITDPILLSQKTITMNFFVENYFYGDDQLRKNLDLHFFKRPISFWTSPPKTFFCPYRNYWSRKIRVKDTMSAPYKSVLSVEICPLRKNISSPDKYLLSGQICPLRTNMSSQD